MLFQVQSTYNTGHPYRSRQHTSREVWPGGALAGQTGMPAFMASFQSTDPQRQHSAMTGGIKEFQSATMKSKIFSTLSIAVLLAAGAFAQAADSGAAPAAATAANSIVAAPNKVGIINIQAAIANTNEGQRDLDALQKKFEPKQIELKSLNDEVDNLKKQLAAQETKLAEDEKTRRVQAIESKQKTLQRELDDAQQEYQNQSNEIAQRIGTKLMQTVNTYATQNGFAVVLDYSAQQSSVLWAAQTVDITKPVIEAYNVVSGVPAPAARPAGSAPSAPAPTTHRPAATTSPATPKPTATGGAAPATTPK